MTLIDAKCISVKYGNSFALHNVDLQLGAGEIVTIVGPNGSGKTSLVRSIIGSIKPETGSVNLKLGLKIGYVPQKLNFDRTLPITVNRFLSLTEKISRAECIIALEKAGVSQVLNKQMSELSGGQFQRALLAKALLGSPELLILDEATQGLDQPGAAAFYRQIERVRNDTGCGVLMISHDLHVVMSASDRVICLNGHVCCSGTPSAVLLKPEYQELFGVGTDGALALYKHTHDHDHSEVGVKAEAVN